MLRILFRLYNKIERGVFEPLWHCIGRMYLRAAGVKYGRMMKLYGLPIVSMHRNSTISMGDNITLRSRSKGNAIGVNHQVILRTQGEGAMIRIGDRVGMSGGAICARKKVVIGNDVLIGANVVIADNDFHSLAPEARNTSHENIPAEEVVIGDGVWLGADVYVCKGVSVGDRSVIGAKSVVTKSIPPNCLAAGIPARVIRMLGDV
jgi:acetyltransferase-like isoleucine patch superfamily enzyme